MASEGLMTSSDVSYATKWARYEALGSSCTARMKGTGEDEDNLLDHVTTPNVVGDMVAIIEAHGEWREREALKILDSFNKDEGEAIYLPSAPQIPLKHLKGNEDDTTIIQRTKWKRGEEKLQYWGFSYGTILGATFAALQPHRVERVILDGVVDAEDYYSQEFKSNFNDTEAVSSTNTFSVVFAHTLNRYGRSSSTIVLWLVLRHVSSVLQFPTQNHYCVRNSMLSSPI